MASSPDHTASPQAAAAGEPSPAVVAATTATTDSNIQPDRPASFGPGPWEREEEQTFVRLTYEPIDVMECLARVRKRHSGAIVMFAGTTRDWCDGRVVDHLFYSAYVGLALRSLSSIAVEAASANQPSAIAITHRLGKVPVGEESIVITVSSPHSPEAWQASQRALTECKRRLEVWKKEVFADKGSVWKANAAPALTTPPSKEDVGLGCASAGRLTSTAGLSASSLSSSSSSSAGPNHPSPHQDGGPQHADTSSFAHDAGDKGDGDLDLEAFDSLPGRHNHHDHDQGHMSQRLDAARHGMFDIGSGSGASAGFEMNQDLDAMFATAAGHYSTVTGTDSADQAIDGFDENSYGVLTSRNHFLAASGSPPILDFGTDAFLNDFPNGGWMTNGPLPTGPNMAWGPGPASFPTTRSNSDASSSSVGASYPNGCSSDTLGFRRRAVYAVQTAVPAAMSRSKSGVLARPTAAATAANTTAVRAGSDEVIDPLRRPRAKSGPSSTTAASAPRSRIRRQRSATLPATEPLASKITRTRTNSAALRVAVRARDGNFATAVRNSNIRYSSHSSNNHDNDRDHANDGNAASISHVGPKGLPLDPSPATKSSRRIWGDTHRPRFLGNDPGPPPNMPLPPLPGQSSSAPAATMTTPAWLRATDSHGVPLYDRLRGEVLCLPPFPIEPRTPEEEAEGSGGKDGVRGKQNDATREGDAGADVMDTGE